MPNSTQLWKVDFAGASGAAWPITWLGSTPAVPSITPRLDGLGSGIAGIAAQPYVWRGRANAYPARSDYKVDLEARWFNPGGQIDREVGLMVRVVDANNYLVARVRSMGAANPEVRLFRRQGGTETQVGSTYSGAGLGASKLFSGIRIRVRVQDLSDGTTDVKVYIGNPGETSDGTLRVSGTTTVSNLRGAFTSGIEVGQLWGGRDIVVDNWTCYDLLDEGSVTPPGQGATGWSVEIDGTLYKANDDTGQLEGLTPAVFLEDVRQGYGPNGNRCTLSVAAFTGGILKPNSSVIVSYNDTIVFRGKVTSGQQEASASNESTTWTCNDAYFLSKQAILTENDGTGVLTFNVTDEDDDTYRVGRQGMTIGDVLQFLFDRYTDGNEGLRFYGACSASGTPYVTADLTAMDAVIPNLAVSNNFAAAVAQLLAYFPKRQVWVDPSSGQWRFKDVTALSGETISLTSEWATIRATPDARNNYTAILWRGAKEEPKAEAEKYYDFGDGAGSLKPAWTKEQEENYTSDKRNLKSRIITITGAYNGTPAGSPSGTSAYIDYSSSEGLDPDDFRGCAVTFTVGAPGQLCLGHTSSRAFFDIAFSTIPTPGSKATFVAMNAAGNPEGAPLGARGVGRNFILLPDECGGSGTGAGNGLLNKGFCGNATVEFTGQDGAVYAQEMGFTVHVATQDQLDAFGCDNVGTIVELAEIPKPPVGLVNFLPPPGARPDIPPLSPFKPGVPPDMCGPLQRYRARVKLAVSEQELVAPEFREPQEGYRGTAYAENAAVWDGGGEPLPSDWGVRQVYTYDDPDFTSSSQITGLRKAAAALLAVYGQKNYLFDVTLGTPWIEQSPQYTGHNTAVSRWAGLTKSVSLSSAKRTTTFESSAFPMFEVTWNVRDRSTTVRAGTASAWLGLEASALTRELKKAAIDKKIDRAVADVAEFQNRFLSKALKMLPKPGGSTPACDVAVIDNVNKRTVTAQEKFDDDQQVLSWLSGELATMKDLLVGENKVVPGDTQVADGTATGFVIPGNGQALGSPGRFDLVFSGPQADVPNSDMGQYGGIPGLQENGMGPPALTLRMGGLAFRTKKDSQDRIIGIEAATLAADGSLPVVGWQQIDKPQDVYALLNRPILSIPSSESIIGILRARDNALQDELNLKQTVEGKPVSPGDVTSQHPDGAPASLGSWLRTPGNSRFFRMVPSSWQDAGGPVWQGPGKEGMWPSRYWRVAVPENVLYEVEGVAAGTGENGGNYDPVLTGDARTFITDGYVVHKQMHGNDMEPDTRHAAVPDLPSPQEPGNPYGFSGDQWRFAGTSTTSGIGATIALPGNGIVSAQANVQVSEDFWSGTTDTPGKTHTFRLDHAWRASAWGASNTGSTNTFTTDGTGTTTGQFLAPMGSVPPGLRAPNALGGGALAVSVVNNGGTATVAARLVGVGVDIARIEGGYWIRATEDATITEVLTAGNTWDHEPMTLAETLVLECRKGLTEALEITEGCSVELNPPVGGAEGITITESVATLLM